MKVYISIPITGRPKEYAMYHALWLKDVFQEHGHTAITPFELCNENKPYPYCIGRNIELTIGKGVDAIVFGEGSYESKGCRLLHAAANIYGKMIIYEETLSSFDFKKFKYKYSKKNGKVSNQNRP